MSGIFTQTPLWVWPLFILLLMIGLRARRERLVPVAMFYALPLLGLSALNTVAGLSGGPPVWIIFGLTYTLGAWGGYLVQQRWLLGREGRVVRLAGERLTLTMMMLVFGANFIGEFLEAVAPTIHGGVLFQMFFVGTVAISSGSFAGRAMRVWVGSGVA